MSTGPQGAGTVDEEDVNELADACLIEERKMGQKTHVLCATLPSGYEIVVSAACVDPDDYDARIGHDICMERLRDRISEYLGIQAHSSV